MKNVKIELSGDKELADALKRHNTLAFNDICLKNLTQMVNRAKNGGTPVDSGELRLSVLFQAPKDNFSGEAGYSKEYAPHVEYGHRTKSGSFVPGQHFLKDNVEVQQKTFISDLKTALERIK